MIRVAAYLAAAAVMSGGAVAFDLHRSVIALSRGEVFYVAMGETCPPGWQNRSADPALIAAYSPASGMEASDMCIGGF